MLRVITSVQEFGKVQSSLDHFVADTSTNWFLLSNWTRYYMIRHAIFRGWVPVIILKVINGNVVGICAFRTKRRFGLNLAQSLIPEHFSPDFLVIPEHRQSFVEQSLEVLFKQMRCQSVKLTLPGDSPQAVVLESYCTRKGLRLARTETSKHSIVLVDREWKEFERLRGRDFRREFRQIENRLTRSGAWRTVQAKANSTESVDKMVSIETHSWKHQERERRKKPILDIDLQALATYQDSPSLAQFTPDIWFLELEGTPIAYTITMEINGVAYFAKTSYDSRYRNLSAGVYVVNTAIRNLFDSKRVSRIDFMTCLPFTMRWASLCEPRETFRMFRGGLVFTLLDSFHRRLRARL